jgi:hypothetical protein
MEFPNENSTNYCSRSGVDGIYPNDPQRRCETDQPGAADAGRIQLLPGVSADLPVKTNLTSTIGLGSFDFLRRGAARC